MLQCGLLLLFCNGENAYDCPSYVFLSFGNSLTIPGCKSNRLNMPTAVRDVDDTEHALKVILNLILMESLPIFLSGRMIHYRRQTHRNREFPPNFSAAIQHAPLFILQQLSYCCPAHSQTTGKCRN